MKKSSSKPIAVNQIRLTMPSATSNVVTMKSIASLMPWSEAETDNNEQMLRQLTKEIVKLFGEWQLNFGHKAPVKNYPVQKAVLWAKVILHIQPTAEQWRLSKENSLFEEWPPSSARDLLALAPVNNPCYPDMHQAYIDAAVNQKYTHAVVYETARRLGFWDLKSKSETVTYKRWQQLYPKVCYEDANGANFALPQSRQITYKHIPIADDSPMAAKVDEFLNGFRRKCGVKA